MTANAGGDSAWLREELRRSGIAFVRQDSYVGGPFPDFYHSTFHAPWYVFDRWGAVLRIKAYLPGASLGFQDIVVMENPERRRRRRRSVARRRPPCARLRSMAEPLPAGDDPPAIAAAAALAPRRPDVEVPDQPRRRGHGQPPARAAGPAPLRRAPAQAARGAAVVHPRGPPGRRWPRPPRHRGRGRPSGSPPPGWPTPCRSQGERVNRLESDLWAAIEKIRHLSPVIRGCPASHGEATFVPATHSSCQPLARCSAHERA